MRCDGTASRRMHLWGRYRRAMIPPFITLSLGL